MSAGTVSITDCDSKGTWMVALEGEHDVATAQQLNEQTQLIWPRCTNVVIDLSRAEFIDSGVIRWLLHAERQLEQFGAFTLSIVVGQLDSVAARTIGLMGVRERFACYETREQALAQAPRHVPGGVAIASPAQGVVAQAAALQNVAADELGDSDADAAELAEVSKAMIGVYCEQFGRTPDYAHSHYSGREAIVCFLQGTLTRAERRLTTPEEHQRLRDMRMLFQYSAETEFRAAIESVTGRKVTAFISGIDTRQDIASEIFLLGPEQMIAAERQA